eukprot:1193642-Prorocentrum_minimum.AAC.1
MEVVASRDRAERIEKAVQLLRSNLSIAYHLIDNESQLAQLAVARCLQLTGERLLQVHPIYGWTCKKHSSVSLRRRAAASCASWRQWKGWTEGAVQPAL